MLLDGEGGDTHEDEEVKDPVDEATGKLPEMIPSAQYIAVKESLGRKISKANEKVTSLEEQLKTAVKKEDHDKLVEELGNTKTEVERLTGELTKVSEASMSEKKNLLIKKGGFTEEQIKQMSEDAINGAIMALERKPTDPRLDLGVGAGKGASLSGTPYELTRQAYSGQG